MQKTLNSDVEAPNVPLDGVSCIAVNGSEESFTNMLVMASWDGTVSAHEVTSKEGGDRRTFVEKIELKSHIKHEAPVLSCAVHNTTVVSGGCDRTVKMWDVAAGQKEFTLGTHQAPVRNVKFVSELGVVVTGGWDKCIKVWDPRQPNQAAAEMALGERVFAMDCSGSMLVAGSADRRVYAFDLRYGLKEVVPAYESPCKYQTRCISLFADGQGFAIGTVEGRVALENFKDMNKPRDSKDSSNFVFKCHRDAQRNMNKTNTAIYAVNDIAFHRFNTLATAGSDGLICMWDKDARHRLGMYDRFKVGQAEHLPVTSCKFSPRGDLLFYALSYDWSMGAKPCDHRGNPIPCNDRRRVMVHSLDPSEVKPKSGR